MLPACSLYAALVADQPSGPTIRMQPHSEHLLFGSCYICPLCRYEACAHLQIMALGRKITSLRSHPNMFKGHPASSSTCCTKLPPLWEGLSAAALHFFSVGQDNRFPSHAGESLY